MRNAGWEHIKLVGYIIKGEYVHNNDYMYRLIYHVKTNKYTVIVDRIYELDGREIRFCGNGVPTTQNVSWELVQRSDRYSNSAMGTKDR
jgi:hypothetical protein